MEEKILEQLRINGFEYVGTKKDKKGATQYILLRNDELCSDFFLVENLEDYKKIRIGEMYRIPYIFGMSSEENGFRKMKILDFKCTDCKNEGKGSILLSVMIEHCKENGISEIWGELSSVDELCSCNKARRNHIYEKFGFANNGRTISLCLNNL